MEKVFVVYMIRMCTKSYKIRYENLQKHNHNINYNAAFAFSNPCLFPGAKSDKAYNASQQTNLTSFDQTPKYGLVIGNADYDCIGKLSSPVLDARAMRDVLKSKGVEGALASFKK